MTYDGGIRIAQWDEGLPWAVGAGAVGQFPDLGCRSTEEVAELRLYAYALLMKGSVKE